MKSFKEVTQKLSNTVHFDLDIAKPLSNDNKNIKTAKEANKKKIPLPIPSSKATYNINESEHLLFYQLLESVYDAIVICDLKGKIITQNERSTTFFKYSASEFLTKNIIDIISGSSTETLDLITNSLEKDRRVFIECSCIDKNQEVFPAEVTVNKLNLTNASELCFFIRNITKRRKTEEELATTNVESMDLAHKAGMADISSGILHDIGNILTSLTTSCNISKTYINKSAVLNLQRLTNLLQEKQNNLGEYFTNDPKAFQIPNLLMEITNTISEEQKELLKELNELENKSQLIRDVVASQQEYAKQGYSCEKILFNDALENALSILSSQIKIYGVQIKTDFPKNLTIETQRTRLTYVLINLIKNAIESMKNLPEKDRIIQCIGTVDETFATINIIDNGIGISKEDLTKIFTHGFTTKKTGNGFGLHASANFLHKSGGTLKANSDGLHCGATFTIVIPTQNVQ